MAGHTPFTLSVTLRDTLEVVVEKTCKLDTVRPLANWPAQLAVTFLFSSV